MTEDLTARLAGLARAMATPLPSPEEIAAGKAEDRALAERICKARPGIPLHHAYAVLETLRTVQRVEAAKAEPTAVTDLYFCPTAREVESASGGGFDACCEHPDLHVPMPDNEATATVSQALSDAGKERFALGQRAEKAEQELAENTGVMQALRRQRDEAEAQVARIRAFLEDMASWCSPHGVAADYSRRGLDALDGVDPYDAIRPREER